MWEPMVSITVVRFLESGLTCQNSNGITSTSPPEQLKPSMGLEGMYFFLTPILTIWRGVLISPLSSL